MFEKILLQMRERVRGHDYIMTQHARKEMVEDNLTIHDVENGIFSGEIVERQKIAKHQNGNIVSKGKPL